MNKPKSNPLEVLLASLYARINYERQLKVTPRSFKLQNMREFLRRLGDPHLAYPVVHVAGTKGKGSVSTMIGQILTSAGRRTGVYVSPHLESINQRMMLGGEPISDEQLVATLQAIEPIADEMDVEANDDDRRKLTFFEVTTAAAFYFFAQQNADAVVLEVGLGGRLDSTNVCQPLVSVITNISFDHMRQLGNTLDKIAAEKAGIIKPGVPVISGALAPEAAKVIADVAAENNSALSVLERDFHVLPSANSDQFSVSGTVGNQVFKLNELSVGLIGVHQQTNAGLAVAAIQSLNSIGWQIDDAQVRDGLARAKLAGRTEIVMQRPTVMLDIAHNVASVKALVATLDELPAWKSSGRKILIMATSREKDAEGMLEPLAGKFDRVIFTKYQNNPRGRESHELLELAAESQRPLAPEILVHSLPVEAWETALNGLLADDFVCIAGSVFLVAELRPLAIEYSQRKRP